MYSCWVELVQIGWKKFHLDIKCMKNINYKDIKLVIWDLDDTFWQGTISESEVIPVEKNLQLLKDLTDRGIINSICSKNEHDIAVEKLKEFNVSEYFVFPSINWENKGLRIKEQLSVMSLRPANVLFIDDNIGNLQEARFYMPDIMIALPEEISELIHFVESTEVTDIKHDRLKQYKVLQDKNIEQKKHTDNEGFLFASNIQLSIHEDCNNQTERILELINRTNQLNFTKKRISQEELKILFADPTTQCGYITVRDKFGDYGIVGFYALRNNYLEHFLFSCRTMGQGVEQYVYAELGFPEIEITGEVQATLDKSQTPKWINQQNSSLSNATENITPLVSSKILLKGPCDLSKSQTYIKHTDAFVTEYTYVNEKKHNIIEGYNHSIHIIGLKENTKEEKQQIASDCVFVNPEMLEGSFFTGNYDIIFLSTIIESGYGIYQKRETNIKIAFAGHNYPITDERNWDDYINGKLPCGNNQFTKEYLTEFSKKYEFIGKTTPDEYINILKKMFTYLPEKTTLCLILGAELKHPKSGEEHVEHFKLNQAVREYAKTNMRLKYVDISQIATSENDFTDTINHFSTRVYYEIAQKMIELINKNGKTQVEQYSIWMIYFDSVLLMLKKGTRKIVNNGNSKLYGMLRNIYWKISRKKH